jgi:hypothetical protein
MILQAKKGVMRRNAGGGRCGGHPPATGVAAYVCRDCMYVAVTASIAAQGALPPHQQARSSITDGIFESAKWFTHTNLLLEGKER